MEEDPASTPTEGRTTPAAGGDDLLAVIAHSLLGSIALVVGGTELLTAHWAELGEEERTDLLATMREQARYVAEVLDNLVRLGDPQLIEALDGLQHGKTVGDPDLGGT